MVWKAELGLCRDGASGAQRRPVAAQVDRAGSGRRAVDLSKRFLDKIKEGEIDRIKDDGSVFSWSPASYHTRLP